MVSTQQSFCQALSVKAVYLYFLVMAVFLGRIQRFGSKDLIKPMFWLLNLYMLERSPWEVSR